MGDLIDRQVAIDAIGKILPVNPGLNEYTHGITIGASLAMEYIKQLPSVQSEPRWIPVSERLPKANELNDDVVRYYLVQNEYGDMMVASWNGKYWEQMYRYKPIEDKVIAWMPLPEPYRKDETNDKD